MTSPRYNSTVRVRKRIQCSTSRDFYALNSCAGLLLGSTCWLPTILRKPRGPAPPHSHAREPRLVWVLPPMAQDSPGTAGRYSDEGPGEGTHRTLRPSFHFNNNKQQYSLRVTHASLTHTAFPSQGPTQYSCPRGQLYIRSQSVGNGESNNRGNLLPLIGMLLCAGS